MTFAVAESYAGLGGTDSQPVPPRHELGSSPGVRILRIDALRTNSSAHPRSTQSLQRADMRAMLVALRIVAAPLLTSS